MGGVISIICISTGRGGDATGEGIAIGGDGGTVNFYRPGASDVLKSLPRANYARHDSGRNGAPSSCLAGTRKAILAEIMSWTESPGRPIYWLSGLAGIGKSTIAKTVADRAWEGGILGASFFFSRGDAPLCDPKLVFPTLALQLAQSNEKFKKVIVDAVRQDDTLGFQQLLPQFRGLILTPLLKANPRRRMVLIVLDALDECEEGGATEILRLLFSLGTQIPFLRIFITSRPEPHISSVFAEDLNHAMCVLHDIESSIIEQDIRLYLKTELAEIPGKLRLRLGPNWVSEHEIDLLVEKSGKLFIYAATSIRFIGDTRVRNPRRQLQLILESQTAQEIGATPYTQLDNLYMGVLRNSLSDSNRRDVLDLFQVVVGSIVLLREPLPLLSLAQFLEYDMDDIDTALYHLRSVIIPPSDEHEAPRIYHPSFRDFIMDDSRCSDPGFVIVPVPEQERRHAVRCFALLKKSLKRDVVKISDPSLLNSEVEEFERRVKDALPPEVQYACRYWALHLSCVEVGDKRTEEALEEFSMRSILWWFEAMSLIGSIPIAISSIQKARHWTNLKCKLPLVTMLSDAHRFILAHAEVIRASALHVYHSALPFAPQETVLYKTYCHEAKDSIQVLQGVGSQWPQNLSTLLHSKEVSHVTYSPDGFRLASSSTDHSVRLWDATSGISIAILEGHSEWLDVAFSPNGLQLASSSADHSVWLWDASSGIPIAKLEGHSDWVNSVAYSPNGLQLASGSDDHTVQLWDTMSGVLIVKLTGHSGPVSSVVYSPNGLQLASGSTDHSVWLWDAMSRMPITIFTGHSDSVWGVAFSPDGLKLASGSADCSVQLWDVMSGAAIIKLEGHSGQVNSVAYSPDGLRLASGSTDCSVWVWDVMLGTPIAMLQGHSLWVQSVAFSPDGLQLASGSFDHSVRVWDTTILGAPTRMPEVHSGWIECVSFSPDGLQLASGSEDHSVWLWDAISGAHTAMLQGHTEGVLSIAFSPSGLQLASGSYDHSVWLWDVTSRACIAVLEGHSGPVSSLVFSPDGSQVISGSHDCSVRLWDAKSGALIATLQGHSEGLTSISFLSNAQIMVSMSDQEIFAWDLTSQPPCHLHTLPSGTSYLPTAGLPLLIWSHNGQWIQVQHYPENHVRRIFCIPPFCRLSTNLVSSPKNPSLIAFGCFEGSIMIIDTHLHLHL